MNQIKERISKIKERIAKAAERADRDKDNIKLIAVSKGQDINKMKAVQEENIVEFGESRVQELRDKYDQLEAVTWHMIGHLQRNKVKYLARRERCQLIHSLDSPRLAKKIDDRGEKAERVMEALVQVNVAKDDNKYGFYPEEVEDFLQQVGELDHLQVKGLMTLAPYKDDPEEVRSYFRQLNEMFTELKEKQLPGIKMEELSMGMTNDFEVAVEEGATMVRVGRGIFGPREYE